ncbi:hypothetical protein GCM10010913_01200 [Paenibacillus aceti]|uniref:Uncharacterized protein n=1 Tax=Paenibacillus aceti TaxID=1820010 RepID=A0ABQ1VNI9_9BACL|nr:hypothetical protein GCM10010913_01200 [Paenibacillus aceti]
MTTNRTYRINFYKTARIALEINIDSNYIEYMICILLFYYITNTNKTLITPREGGSNDDGFWALEK